MSKDLPDDYDAYAQLQRLGPKRVRYLVETGYYVEQDERKKEQQAAADKKWQAAGRALKQHKRRRK